MRENDECHEELLLTSYNLHFALLINYLVSDNDSNYISDLLFNESDLPIEAIKTIWVQKIFLVKSHHGNWKGENKTDGNESKATKYFRFYLIQKYGTRFIQIISTGHFSTPRAVGFTRCQIGVIRRGAG